KANISWIIRGSEVLGSKEGGSKLFRSVGVKTAQVQSQSRGSVDQAIQFPLFVRCFGDQVHQSGDSTSSIKGRRSAFDHLYLFQVQRHYLQQTQSTGEAGIERIAILQQLGVFSVEPLDPDAGVKRGRRRLL